MRQRAWGALVVTLLATPAQAAPLASPGCLYGGDTATITAIDDDLDLRLGDGRDIRIPGLDPVRATSSRPTGVDQAKAVLARWLIGRPVRVLLARPDPDRWGRTIGLVFAPAPGAESAPAPMVSVAEAMLDAGLARGRPDDAVEPCWRSYRGLEAGARQSGLGLWSDPLYRPIQADDTATLATQTGGLALVEGKVADIWEGRSRTYLHLTANGKAGFAITIERHAALRLAKMGIDIKAWAGKLVRVRGFLDDRFGLQIELTSPDQIEILTP